MSEINYYPPIITELIELIGEEQTRNLVKRRGGSNLFVPKLNHQSWLELADDALDKLCKTYGGQALFIPRCHVALRQKRDQEIREARSEGKSINWLVQKFGLSNRRIIDICCEHNSERSQSSWLDM